MIYPQYTFKLGILQQLIQKGEDEGAVRDAALQKQVF